MHQCSKYELARISHTLFSGFDFTEIRTNSGFLWVMCLPMAAVGTALAVLTGLTQPEAFLRHTLTSLSPREDFLVRPGTLR